MAEIASAYNLISQLQSLEADEGPLQLWLQDGRLVSGPYPSARYHFDFASENFTNMMTSTPIQRPIKRVERPEGGRRTGNYALKVRQENYEFANLRQLLSQGLLILEALKPGVLEELENHKPRSKRVVSRQREALYEDPNLVAKFSENLSPGWFFATNNSAAEVRRYLTLGARFAGLTEKEFAVVA